jgi:pimeloyl-ACP methyl ester carboxylesterase
MSNVKHLTRDVNGTSIFYREAGPNDAPSVLLLHGFPSSSYQFRFVLPTLAEEYHVVAPDLPGFGFSACPERTRYTYTFEHLTDTTEAFMKAIGFDRCALYLHDYGAQVGFRLALRDPSRVRALIVQNSEAYTDGRTGNWAAMEAYWRDPSLHRRQALRDSILSESGIRREFVENLPTEIAELIDPAVIRLACAQLSRPGVIDAMLDLHLDYRTNVELYPTIQTYFRQHRPSTLIVWGREDQYCSPAAALAYRRDLPAAEIRMIEGGGHWAIESHTNQVLLLARDFLRATLAGP